MADNYLHRSTDDLKYLKVFMYRPDMNFIPTYPLPAGYSLQLCKGDGQDRQKWAEIAMAAGEFLSIEEGFEKFDKYCSTTSHKRPLLQRIHFLVNADGKYIGTASAGFDDIIGEQCGSLDWVSIIPEYQGKKLAKPMVSAVLHKIAEYADKCTLHSQTTSWRALNMYADFGFVPLMRTDDCREAWQRLSEFCHRKFIEGDEQLISKQF